MTNPESVLRRLAYSGRLPSYPELLLANECARILQTSEAEELRNLIHQRHRILVDSNVCASKRRYDDKKAAISQINLIRRRHARRRKNANLLSAYPCPICAGWHLTARTEQDDR